MRGWSRRRIVVVIAATACLIWLLTVVWTLLSVRSSMNAGARGVRAVRHDASVATLVEPSTATRLTRAHDHFASARSRVASPVLLPLRALPVAGRHIRAVERLADTSVEATDLASSTLDDLTALTERPRRSGPGRVDTLRDLSAVAAHVERSLARLDPGKPDALVGPVGDAVAEARQEQASAERAAGQLRAVSAALADVLDGPDPYLLLGANNAEMRNGSGMFLSAAELGFDHGSMELGEVRSTADLVLPEGAVPVEGDLAANWPWLDPGRDMRNLGLTADFPQSARLAVANWAKATGNPRPAGVIVVDIDALRALLRVVGPVEVDGVTYDPDNVRGELLREQYSRFDGDREGRRDQLGAVAHAVFDDLEAGDWELQDLAAQLTDIVTRRHLLIWSSDATHERAWHDTGADGHLSTRSVSVGLLNRGASKLDSWLDTSGRIRTGRGRISITYEIHNGAPSDWPGYVIGPNVEGLSAGDHRAWVVANLPAGTTDVQMDGARVFLRGGDGPTVVVGGELVVRRGEKAQVTISGTLPAKLRQVVLEPSARIPQMEWTVDGEPIVEERRTTLTLRVD